jgi:hypothetical protein
VCLLGAAGVPITRGDESFRVAGVRVAAVAFLALVAAVVIGWSALVPISVALVGGIYAAELAIDDAPLDTATPAIAVLLLLACELAYWSLDETDPLRGEPGERLRRVAFVALLGIAAAAVGAVLLALADAVRAESLAVDLGGAVAAVAVLATVLLVAQSHSGDSEP